MPRYFFALILFSFAIWPTFCVEEQPAPAGPAPLRLATFDVDATPPVGSWMAYDPVTNKWDLGLRARGIVLLGAEQPIVLCALDWIGIANEGNAVFRQKLAEAAGTSPSRVAVHTLHQHDAPECDFAAEKILKEVGIPPRNFEGTFARQLLDTLAKAVRQSLTNAVAISEIGLGEAKVLEVASNRRIHGPDGKVRAVRWSATPDPAVRAEPEGKIDPMVSLVSFWGTNGPVAVLSYYATHPQSYYRTAIPNPDFPGVARFLRQLAVPDALHVHFNGAGGNITAGKYNDGSHSNRLVLAQRLADGMARAWAATRREPINAGMVKWKVEPVMLPIAVEFTEQRLLNQMNQPDGGVIANAAAGRLAFLRRGIKQVREVAEIPSSPGSVPMEVACLSLGRARILHMPGELFVEYQLAAKAERPDLFVAMAAYGDYGPGYVGTAVAYQEGGYETGPTSSNVAPEVEAELMRSIQKLLR